MDNNIYSTSRTSSSYSNLAELRQRAYVEKSDTEKYNIKRWLNSVYSLYEQVIQIQPLREQESEIQMY